MTTKPILGLPMDALSNAILRYNLNDVIYLVEREKLPITHQHIDFAQKKKRELPPQRVGAYGPFHPIDAIISYLSTKILTRSRL